MTKTLRAILLGTALAAVGPLSAPAFADSACSARLWSQAQAFGVQFGELQSFRLERARLLEARTDRGRDIRVDPTEIMVPTPIIGRKGAEVAINVGGEKVWLHRRYVRARYYGAPRVSEHACRRVTANEVRAVKAACDRCYGE